MSIQREVNFSAYNNVSFNHHPVTAAPTTALFSNISREHLSKLVMRDNQFNGTNITRRIKYTFFLKEKKKTSLSWNNICNDNIFSVIYLYLNMERSPNKRMI